MKPCNKNLRRFWLMPARGEIENRQAPVCEYGVRTGVDPSVVWAPVAEAVAHGGYGRRDREIEDPVQRHHAAYRAHQDRRSTAAAYSRR